ncbi:MAG: dihydrodipicolinate synthase family protein [Chloroflexi bacterium]|nr:dihydrodipicolinate synthase family protein [Chloroflexota bacterium]
MAEPFHGIYNIMATPFTPDGEIDEESLRNLVEFQIGHRVHGLAILGILGEVHRLSDAERQRVTRVVIDQVKGRVPVVVGTGHSGTKVAVWLSQDAAAAGAAALLLPPPGYSKPTPDALFEYYRAVSEAVSIPVVVQDEPATTGVTMPPDLFARLASNLAGCRYAKVEDPPTPSKITRIRALTDRLGIFGGLGGAYLLEELHRGAAGTMTGFAFPEILVEIYTRYAGGDVEGATELFFEYVPLIRYEAQIGIGLAIRKEVLRLRGAIRHNTVRAPAAGIDETTRRELHALVERYGLR